MSQNPLVQQRQQGNTLILSIHNPPVNALSPGVPEGLIAGLNHAEQSSDIQAVIITGADKAFIGGADIHTFNRPVEQAPDVRGLIERLEHFTKPTIAAINSVALGGGLEVALACHYRVAHSAALLGLPEVKLGVLPGGGGTQRLTRLLGPQKALEMMLSGKPITAPQALELGLVDQVTDSDLLTVALDFAQKHHATRPLPRISERVVTAPSPDFFAQIRARIAKTHKGQLAPSLIVDLAEMAVDKPFARGWEAELTLFQQAVNSPQSRALRHLFFAQREAAKVPNVDKTVTPRPVKVVGIIGAGTMGSGIAMNFLNAGLQVTLIDSTPEGLERGVGIIRATYEASASKGRLSAEDMQKRLSLLTTSLNMAELSSADFIIEAAFENMEIKKDIFRALDRIAQKGAILASNTSTLDINEIASVTQRSADVLGMHFFSPAHIMKLLEVVRGNQTSPQALATALALGRSIGKVSVVVGVCPGFVGNRMLGPYVQQAQELVLGGASPEDIDSAMHALGMPMGPFEMGDMSGLDIGYAARREAAKKEGAPPKPDWTDGLVEMGRKGQKTGAGIYDYPEGSRTPTPSPITQKLLAEFRAKHGIKPRQGSEKASQQEIIKRLAYSLSNEGARILQEGVAQRSSDIDVVYIYGYGFPDYLGGPMHYAQEQGLANVLRDLERYGIEPAPLLVKLAQEGKTFADWDKEQNNVSSG